MKRAFALCGVARGAPSTLLLATPSAWPSASPRRYVGQLTEARALDEDDMVAAAPAATSWKGVKRFYVSARAAPRPDGSWGVVIDGRPLRTNGMGELTLPSAGLAVAIAAEFAAQGSVIIPATTPLYSLASTAIDSYVLEDVAASEDYEAYVRAQRLSMFDKIAARQEAEASLSPTPVGSATNAAGILAAARASDAQSPSHASLESGRGGSGALTSSGSSGTSRLRDLALDTLETDTCCYRVQLDTADLSERALRKRQDRYYAPLQQWFSESFGVGVGTAEGFEDLLHPEEAYIAAEGSVDAASPWVKAALAAALGATKSTIISLAFVHHHVDADGAYDASRLEEEWQISENGFVEDGHDTNRVHARCQLTAVSAFLALLPPAAGPEALVAPTRKDFAAAVQAAKAARAERVRARREREAALVARKRTAMLAMARQEAEDEVARARGLRASSSSAGSGEPAA